MQFLMLLYNSPVLISIFNKFVLPFFVANIFGASFVTTFLFLLCYLVGMIFIILFIAIVTHLTFFLSMSLKFEGASFELFVMLINKAEIISFHLHWILLHLPSQKLIYIIFDQVVSFLFFTSLWLWLSVSYPKM